MKSIRHTSTLWLMALGAMILALAWFSLPASAGDDGELSVKPSPTEHCVLQLNAGDSVVDTDVSPKGAVTAVLVRNADSQSLLFWNFVDNRVVARLSIPAADKISAIAWHPRGEALYAIRQQGHDWQIVRIAAAAEDWRPTVLYRAAVPLRRLVFSTQRFTASYLSKTPASVEFRVYFGAQAAPGKWEIRTMRESGDSPYALAGTAPAPMPPADKNDPDTKGKQFKLSSALPASFHTSGGALLIQDEKSCHAELRFNEADWDEPKKLQWRKQPLCGGSLVYTPNGMGFFQWRKGVPGLLYRSHQADLEKTVAGDAWFIATPSSTADGKGVVGVTQSTEKAPQLEYVPVDVPLGDIFNAWMFVARPDELKLYARNGGLFRPGNNTDQLYGLYDEESYGHNCGAAAWRPKRPYLITTDLFWENFGAAFEAAFILNERYQAIPAFRQLVGETNRFFSQNQATHRLAMVFGVAAHILDPRTRSAPNIVKEAAETLAGASAEEARLLGEKQVRYHQFRPRGHYVKTEENRRYFAAMRYLAALRLTVDEARLVATLPATIQQAAKAWIGAYRPFIAAPRAPLAWPGLHIPLATPLKEPLDKHSLFPLSWARDNETFYNTTSHDGEMEPLGIEPRLMPSGLDLAFVFGSNYARHALAEDLTRYPRLERRLDKLRQEIGALTPEREASLYDSWISGLARQWEAHPAEPGTATLAALDAASQELWSAKRLQTGLDSWATLRHATVLVNDQSGAEGGQGGFSFERLVVPPPRGYVEPDPETFKTIENLYGKLISALNGAAAAWPKNATTQDLKKGLIAQLNETRSVIGGFRSMATKLVRGEALSDEEYKTIENVGGLVEHDFKLMKSVQVKDNGLAEPDPIARITDVAQAPELGLSLQVAVGSPLEWDQAVPFYGKRELVRGAVYSYYEFTSAHPLTDEEWRQQLGNTPRPAWVQPFLARNPLGCPELTR